MTETDIKYRCFYVEEEVPTLPCTERVKRKNADTTPASSSTKRQKSEKEIVCIDLCLTVIYLK